MEVAGCLINLMIRPKRLWMRYTITQKKKGTESLRDSKKGIKTDCISILKSFITWKLDIETSLEGSPM